MYTENRVLFFEENWNLKVKAVTLPLKGTVSHYALHIKYVCIVSRIAGRYAPFLLGGPFLSIPARSTALSTALSTAPFKLFASTFYFLFLKVNYCSAP